MVVRTKIVEGKTEVLVQSAENYRRFHHGDFKDLQMGSHIVPVLCDKGIYFRSTESGGQITVKRILVMHGNHNTQNAVMDTGTSTLRSKRTLSSRPRLQRQGAGRRDGL